MTRPLVTDAEIRAQCALALGRAKGYATRIETASRYRVDLAAFQSAALLGVALAVRRFDPSRGAAFATFAYAAVLHELHNEKRRQAIRPGALPPLSLDTLMEEGGDRFLDGLLDDGPTPEEAALRAEEYSAQLVLFDEITAAMDTIKPHYAHILRRVYLEDVPIGTAAREAGYTTGGSGATLRSAKRAVRSRLGLEKR